MSDSQRSDRPKKRPLTPDDIVTRQTIGRRSALGLLGGTVVGATALVVGTTPAKADRFDVNLLGDPNSDEDSGPFGDRPGDADTTVLADGSGEAPPGGATDADAANLGDAKSTDTDLGRGADTFDNDRTVAGDLVGGGDEASGKGNQGGQTLQEPVGDGDVTRVGDPVDSDIGSRADTGDSDITIEGDVDRPLGRRPGGGGSSSGTGSGSIGGSGSGSGAPPRVTDPSDNDVTSAGDPIPARDKDSSDPSLADSDETRTGDPADSD